MAIQPNELRVGNYILYLDELYIVDGIKYEENAPEQKYRIAFKTIDGKLRNAKMSNWINPIPLTPSVLTEWCGFSCKQGGSDNIYEWHIGNNPVTHDWLFCITEFRHDNTFFYRNGYHVIKYLHQLQNLYFALTGEELTVNL